MKYTYIYIVVPLGAARIIYYILRINYIIIIYYIKELYIKNLFTELIILLEATQSLYVEFIYGINCSFRNVNSNKTYTISNI